jgi:general stress protein 26
MQDRTDREAKDKVLALIKGARIAMMVTHGERGVLHARPMATNHAAFEGELWFLADITSEKVADIARDPEVLLTYSDEGRNSYVSISGHAEPVRDRRTIEELWFEPARAWFPDGLQDPRLGAIRVKVDFAEYWDAPSGTMVYVYGYVKSLITRKPVAADAGDHGTVRF